MHHPRRQTGTACRRCATPPDRCRRRIQQELHGHRGLAGDPLYRATRTLHTGDGLLTDRQRERLMVLFGDAEHVEVAATWGANNLQAYFDRPGASNGPTEALNGRLEHLRGSALGFRNLTNYIARSLLETGGFKPRLHPGLG